MRTFLLRLCAFAWSFIGFFASNDNISSSDLAGYHYLDFADSPAEDETTFSSTAENDSSFNALPPPLGLDSRAWSCPTGPLKVGTS